MRYMLGETSTDSTDTDRLTASPAVIGWFCSEATGFHRYLGLMLDQNLKLDPSTWQGSLVGQGSPCSR